MPIPGLAKSCNQFRLFARLPAANSEVDYAESFYREAFTQAGVAMAMVALDGRYLNVNRAFCQLVGYDRCEMLDKTFQSLTHPDDKEMGLQETRDLVSGRIDEYHLEKRYIRRDGSVLWGALHLGIVRNSSGQPLYFVAQIENITARKLAEAARDSALMQTQAVLNAATTLSIIATDLAGTITLFNTGAENLLGYSSAELVGKATPVIFHLPSELEARSRELTEQFGREICGFDVFVDFAHYCEYDEREWTYVRRDGSHVPVSLVVTAQRDLDGTLVGFQGIATDITLRKRQEQELQALTQHYSALALIDSLTGIDNRRCILDRLTQLWNSQSATEPLSLIVIDIDHFKRINDRLGHNAGDDVIRSVASTIKSSIRSTDHCGRYGGEEFVVVCPQTTRAGAAGIGQRIRSAVERCQIAVDGDKELQVTISLGVADRVEGAKNVAELIATADSRLYQAKAQGRNCLVDA